MTWKKNIIIVDIVHLNLYFILLMYLKFYINIFSKIETNLFNNWASLTGINDKDYQVIFIGHSIGGAISTLNSFYILKNKIYLQKIF